MKKAVLWQILLIIAVLAVCGGWVAWRWTNDPHGPINLGLDLRGGVHVLIECLTPKNEKLTVEKVSGVIDVMRNRLDPDGVREIAIQKQGARWVNIEIPGERNPERVKRLIGKTALLEFVDTRGKHYEEGTMLPKDRKVVFTGEELKRASAGFDSVGRPAVHFDLKSRGADIFGKFTSRNIGKYLAITLDGKVMSCPVINSAIFGGSGIIQGRFSRDEIQELVTVLNAGRLPVPVQIAEMSSVGPTLGKDSIRKSLRAGILGLIIVLVFMIAYYRLPGVLADLALSIYVVIMFGVLSMFNATLTLPGIAGFILSIGMAVDANIIIFERIKEELRWGKTLKGALEAGFSRAFPSILDSNVTTLIASVVLYALGTGAVRGFAVTLSLGVLISMFSALTVTKTFLTLVVNLRGAQNTVLYGVKTESAG